jgi:hypothetical protein
MEPMAPLEVFRSASRALHDAFLPLIGVVPADDLREEFDGQRSRLRGLLDWHTTAPGK